MFFTEKVVGRWNRIHSAVATALSSRSIWAVLSDTGLVLGGPVWSPELGSMILMGP